MRDFALAGCALNRPFHVKRCRVTPNSFDPLATLLMRWQNGRFTKTGFESCAISAPLSHLRPANIQKVDFMAIQEGQTVGIDLGTTFSALAQLGEDGHPISLNNADGKPITPSVILLGDDGHVIVGPSVERMAIEDPQNIVEAIKRQMGNKDFFVVYQGKKLTPEFISALILKKMKQDAETQIGPIANAVITVPYYFNDVRRKATQDAGRIAGLNVIDIINEPTAATLAYAWNKGRTGSADKGTHREDDSRVRSGRRNVRRDGRAVHADAASACWRPTAT